MKHFLASICISLSLASNFALADTSDTGRLTSLNDISLLAQRGLSDETILIFLEKRSLDFNLTAENIDQLLQSGVSEDVVQYLLQQQTSQPVYVTTPTATYINPYPTYYYSPQYNHISTSAPLLHGFAAASYTFGHHETFQPHYSNSISHSQRPQHSGVAIIHNSGLSVGHNSSNNRHNNVTHSSGGHNVGHRRSHNSAGYSQTHSRGGHSGGGGGHRGGGGGHSSGGHRNSGGH